MLHLFSHARENAFAVRLEVQTSKAEQKYHSQDAPQGARLINPIFMCQSRKERLTSSSAMQAGSRMKSYYRCWRAGSAIDQAKAFR